MPEPLGAEGPEFLGLFEISLKESVPRLFWLEST